jgi:hypothetical protein
MDRKKERNIEWANDGPLRLHKKQASEKRFSSQFSAFLHFDVFASVRKLEIF